MFVIEETISEYVYMDAWAGSEPGYDALRTEREYRRNKARAVAGRELSLFLLKGRGEEVLVKAEEKEWVRGDMRYWQIRISVRRVPDEGIQEVVYGGDVHDRLFRQMGLADHAGANSEMEDNV